MSKSNIIASGREANLFMSNFCQNNEARYRIPEYFTVSVDVYEDYAPGQTVYGWVNKGKLLRNSGIMLKVEDDYNKLNYYPIFPPKTAISMLKHWHMPLPEKWSVFAYGNNQPYQPFIHPINQQMRNLLAYARLFATLQQRYSTPMPYGFKEIHAQLLQFPEQAVDGDVVALINKVIGQYLTRESTFLNCENLRDFIIYLHINYTLLKFISHDFSLLRELLRKEAPDMHCYF